MTRSASVTICSVPKASILAIFFLGAIAVAQEQPQDKVKAPNVCTLSAREQGVIMIALSAVPARAVFISDFEVTRGMATRKDGPPLKFVRLRREFPPESAIMTAQYSMSTAADYTIELLVLREREAKYFQEMTLEDRVSSGMASPVAIVGMDRPVSQIKVERLGQPTVGLARCAQTDQSEYEPLFNRASVIMARYREALGLRAAFRSDIEWLTGNSSVRNTGTTSKKSP